jgi:geranylgeranyl pyrophosphate synthase
MFVPNWFPLHQEKINTALQQIIELRYPPLSIGVERVFEEAMSYALLTKGKRIRPILAYLAYEYAKNIKKETPLDIPEELLECFCGLEALHAFTLVHDDLPCMDNDELRRGELTVWKKYGEGIALLVWDALQSLGYELLAKAQDIRIIQEMTRTIGDKGVCLGQVRDSYLRHDTLSIDELLRIHDEKTGIFIANSLVVGAILWWSSHLDIQRLRNFGILLGRAFQIQDDILDATGDVMIVGKNTKKDAALGKGIVSLLGLEASKNVLSDIQKSLEEELSVLNCIKLTQMTEFVMKRES